MNIYYVYAYLRSSDNTPYYIGKGKDKRAFSKQHGVSVPKDKSKIVFLETNLTEIGALALERRYIRWYGRKDLNNGVLHNKTEGGDMPPVRSGPVGPYGPYSIEDRIKKYASRRGKNPAHSLRMKGRPAWNKGVKTGPRGPMSEEHKAKISASKKSKLSSTDSTLIVPVNHDRC
jgi:hypothetical protein